MCARLAEEICREVIQMTPLCSLPLRGQCLGKVGRCSLSLPELPRGTPELVRVRPSLCLFLALFRAFY